MADEVEWTLILFGETPPKSMNPVDIKLLDVWFNAWRDSDQRPVCSICDGAMLKYNKLRPGGFVIGKPPNTTEGQAMVCGICDDCSTKPEEFVIIAMRAVLERIKQEQN